MSDMLPIPMGIKSEEYSGNGQAQLACVEYAGYDGDDGDYREPLVINPIADSFSLQRQVNWSESGLGRGWGGFINYTGGQADQLSFTVLFDESMKELPPLDESLLPSLPSFGASGNTKNVQHGVRALYRLTLPLKNMYVESKGDKKFQEALARPPLCVFVWGNLEFAGYIESLQVEYKVFDHEGNPRRAAVQVSMKGRAFTGGLTAKTVGLIADEAYIEPYPKKGLKKATQISSNSKGLVL